MSRFRYLTVLLLLGVLAAYVPVGAVDDLYATLSKDARFATLVKGMQAAGMADTLKGAGPYTVFAPTNDAFAKLPAGQWDALSTDKPRLGSFLLSHIAFSNLKATQLARLQFLATLQGGRLAIASRNKKITVDNANIIEGEIPAANGVIYVIDTVLQPRRTICEVLAQDGHFTRLLQALQAANLTNTVNSSAPITLFAPTDDAIAKLPAGSFDALLADVPRLTRELEYHIVPGKVMLADLQRLHSVPTLLGAALTLKIAAKIVHVNDAVASEDLPASNGIIHILDVEIAPQ